jgi:hypothetical protein
LSGRFIIAMQGQFEMSFGLQYLPMWWYVTPRM